MATKRMFTKKITESDAFLEMPASTQNLYFHLNMSADDDGFVNNSRRVMGMIGASEDDLKILLMKSFLIKFETGVIVIKHWWMHNTLRKDRYTPTDYTDEKAALYIKENDAYTLDEGQGKPLEMHVITDGDNSGNQMATIRQPSIDKIRLDKIREDYNTSAKADTAEAKKERIDWLGIEIAFNVTCHKYLPRITEITDARKKAVMGVLQKHRHESALEFLTGVFEKVAASDFLTGRKTGWKGCSFDWILKPANFQKIIEGNYDNGKKGKPGGPDNDDFFKHHLEIKDI